MYCEQCGKEIPEGTKVCGECAAKSQSKSKVYISAALAILGIILPFLRWIEIPVANGLYSLFGMSQEVPKFSLFGYILAGNQYQTGSVYTITLIIAIIAFVGIIFNAIYVIKTLKNANGCYKYGTLGAVIMTVMSILFILIVGLTALILKLIKLTAMPYLTLIVSIANIVVIKKLKKENA